MSSETEKRLYLPENLELENPFWLFSLDVWCQPEVRRCLLRCQDELALRVSQLLLSAWLAQQNRLLLSSAVRNMPELVQWQGQMIDSLRACRMQLPVLGQACAKLKRHIQDAEVLAEQFEVGWLYANYESLSEVATGDNEIIMINFVNYTKEALSIAPTCPLPANVLALLQDLEASFGHLKS